MADDVQSILAEAFNEIAAGLTGAATSVSSTTISSATAQAGSNVSTTGYGTYDSDNQYQGVSRLFSGGSSSSSGGSSGGNPLLDLFAPGAAGAVNAATSSESTAEKIASFLPMGGLIEGLIGMFGGGSSTPAPLVKYAMPAAADFTANLNADGSTSAADFSQDGTPRTYGSSTGGGGAGGNSTPINLTINALDSQSILNRADDIAAAVRGAMLNGNSINDVITNDL